MSLTSVNEGSTITLTINGEAVGVMMTPDRYDTLLETIEILADKKIIEIHHVGHRKDIYELFTERTGNPVR